MASKKERVNNKYKRYKVASKNLNTGRLRNKYFLEEEIELLDDITNVSMKKNKGNIILNFFKLKTVIFICSFGLILLLSFFTYRFLTPTISLNGNSHIIINYKEKYKELGYKANFRRHNITSLVKVKGKVNSKKLGTYKIDYKVKYHGITTIVSRYVLVKDISKPNISVDSSDDIYVCPDSDYEVVSYKAFDNYDGDITGKVKVLKKKDYILYSVSDKAGNKASVRKNVIYKDVVKPELTLNDGDTIYLYVGDKFSDSFKAVDNCDGDITSMVSVSGSVDTSVAGQYKLTYKVSDNASNSVNAVRKVIVSEKNRDGVIYLTFDDGPKSGTTDVILDILKEEGVKATFFVTNGGPDELIKRAYDEGHTIALHTASHEYSYVYSSVENYYNDLKVVSDRVKRITGVESKIVRFPGGSSNTVSGKYTPGIMSFLTQDLLSKGYKYYDWNLSSGDASYGSHTGEEISRNVINNLSSTRVNMVLMHDIKPYTRDALRDIIRYGKEHGYTFDKITMSTNMITQKVNN